MSSATLQDGQWFTEIEKNYATAFSLQIKRKLHEEQTSHQHIVIYHTEKLGNAMTINGSTVLTEKDGFIQHEMMTHPALFSHPQPQKIAILNGSDGGMLREVLKHKSVTDAWQIEKDPRITQLTEQYFPSLCASNHDSRAHFYFGNTAEWLTTLKPNSLDIIIANDTTQLSTTLFRQYFQALHSDGILIQQSAAVFQLATLKNIQQYLQTAGFADSQTLTFTQPTLSSSWRVIIMAKKQGVFRKLREKDIFNRPFKTRYYNYDIHKAALALPEFMREELTS